MPIKIPNKLPAFATLATENIFALPIDRAESQDIRPLKILVLNLMPKKIETEVQLLRVLSNTPIQVEVELLGLKTHTPKNTHSDHLEQFYKYFDDIKQNRYDGMIITGAPVELLQFNEVNYWDELCDIMTWADKNVYSVLHICWAAQAALYHRYGIDKYKLPQKLSGVFAHVSLDGAHPLLRGFDDCFWAPHSRHTDVRLADIDRQKDLKVLCVSPEAGAYIIEDTAERHFYVTGHPEYDRETLKNEYDRDTAAGKNPRVPQSYFPNDDVTQTPLFSWKSHAHLLYSNWLNYFVYQQTPYDLSKL